MRASAEAWLAKNAPVALQMIGGKLSQIVYTFARYMHSEVGSGTIEERVAVGEAGLNQARLRAGTLGNWASKLNEMLIPWETPKRPHAKGLYGAIHAPDAYCASLGKEPGCNAANRWAATTRDPSVLSLLLAHLVVSGGSKNFAKGAATQWGPEYLKNPDGSRMGTGTTPERVASFVKYAASSSGGQYYWVGPLPGVDPWHTFLTAKGPAATTMQGQALILRGIAGLQLSNGKPVRPVWPADLPVCGGLAGGFSGAEIALALLGVAAGAYGATRFNRWLAGEPV